MTMLLDLIEDVVTTPAIAAGAGTNRDEELDISATNVATIEGLNRARIWEIELSSSLTDFDFELYEDDARTAANRKVRITGIVDSHMVYQPPAPLQYRDRDKSSSSTLAAKWHIRVTNQSGVSAAVTVRVRYLVSSSR